MSKRHTFKNARDVRNHFWNSHTGFHRVPGQRQNEYNVDIRSAFVEFVDLLERNGDISNNLAQTVTL